MTKQEKRLSLIRELKNELGKYPKFHIHLNNIENVINMTKNKFQKYQKRVIGGELNILLSRRQYIEMSKDEYLNIYKVAHEFFEKVSK